MAPRGGSFHSTVSRTVTRSFNATFNRTINPTITSNGMINLPSLPVNSGQFAVSLGRAVNGMPTFNALGPSSGQMVNSNLSSTLNTLLGNPIGTNVLTAATGTPFINPVTGTFFNSSGNGVITTPVMPFGSSFVPFNTGPFSTGVVSPGAALDSFGGGGDVANGGPPETPESTVLKGEAQVIAAQGAYNQSTAAAAAGLTEAQSREMKNEVAWVKSYYDRRATGQTAREHERGPRPTSAELAHRAQAGAPRLLTTNQIDPVSGELHWPGYFQDPQFEEQRAVVGQLAMNWVRYGQLDFEEKQQMRAAVGVMLQGLKSQINVLSPSEYIACRKFLDSLIYATTHSLT
jgi:hypothetical protein